MELYITDERSNLKIVPLTKSTAPVGYPMEADAVVALRPHS
jgi:hypothetical protein